MSFPESPGVGLVLKAHNEVVGIAHDDHVGRGLAPSLALGPQVEHVVQVLLARSGPLFADAHDPMFQHARLEPFLDQADDAFVTIRCFRNRVSHSWLTVSKNNWMSASKMKFIFRLWTATTSASSALSCAIA